MISELQFRAYLGKEPYIFVSYAHTDKEIVYLEMLWIKEKEYRIWYDEGIIPTKEWLAEVEKAILNCKFFLVYITPNAIESQMVRNEIIFAYSKKKPFLAIFLKPTELKYGLNLIIDSLQYIKKYELKEEYYKNKVLDSLDHYFPSFKDDKKFVDFKGSKIHLYEANFLEEIENLTNINFKKVDNIEDYQEMCFKVENQKLIGLGLYNCGLSYIPESISNLKSLQILDLSKNKIKILPNSICNLNSLVALYLEDNLLSELPESISNLKSLQLLNLYNNQIIELSKSITQLNSLSYLNLSGNPLIKKENPEFNRILFYLRERNVKVDLY